MPPRRRLQTTIGLIVGAIVAAGGCASTRSDPFAHRQREPKTTVYKSDDADLDVGERRSAAPTRDALAARDAASSRSSKASRDALLASPSRSTKDRRRGSERGSKSADAAIAENPFRRNEPSHHPFGDDQDEPPDDAPRPRSVARAERVDTQRRRDDSEPPTTDRDDETLAAAPVSHSDSRTELDSLIDEELRLAERDERPELARTLRESDPMIARQLILLRRYARRRAEDRNDDRSEDFEDDARTARRDTRRAFPAPDDEDRRRRPRPEPKEMPQIVLDLNGGTRPATLGGPASPNMTSGALGLHAADPRAALAPPPSNSAWSGASPPNAFPNSLGNSGRDAQMFGMLAQSNYGPTGPSAWPAPGTPRSIFSAGPQQPQPRGFAPTAPPTYGAEAVRAMRPGPLSSATAARATAPYGTYPTQPASTQIVPVAATTAGYAGGPQPLGAAGGLMSPPAQADLQRLVAVAEQDAAAARLGPEATDDERRIYIEKHVALRLLYLMSGQQDRALATIPNVDAADQEFWKQFFFSISTYFDGQSYPEPTGRAAQTAAQLRTAVDRLQDAARLELRNVAFCHKITSFGSFEKFPRDEFARGQPVLMYSELTNFKSVPAADGQYLTRVRSTVEFYNSAGGLVHRITFPETEDLCRNRRRDYYHSYEFNIPGGDKIQLGPHTLKLIVEDQLSRKVAEETIGFVVK